MGNMNNFQGKRPDQYKNSARFASYGILGMIILLIIVTLLGGCVTTQPVKKCCDKEQALNDIESDKVTYFKDSEGCFYGTNIITNKHGVYWGWYEGSYYYYGVSHNYPWYHYYDKRPPYYYNANTHVIIKRPTINRKSYGFKRTNKTTTRRK